MWKWLNDNWFKILIVVILAWFGYYYIKTLEINEFVQCDLAVLQHDNSPTGFTLCTLIMTHQSAVPWAFP